MIKFPKHKASMEINHNLHKTYYEPIEYYLINKYETHFINWQSEEDKTEAIKNDELWEMVWYPNTPVGSISILASSFEKLIEYALQVESFEEFDKKFDEILK